MCDWSSDWSSASCSSEQLVGTGTDATLPPDFLRLTISPHSNMQNRPSCLQHHLCVSTRRARNEPYWVKGQFWWHFYDLFFNLSKSTDCETADCFKQWTSFKEQGLMGHAHPFHLFVLAQPLKAFLLMCLLASLFFPENQAEMSIPVSPLPFYPDWQGLLFLLLFCKGWVMNCRWTK